ncbi:putative iron-sulfur protein [Caenibius tardaugens NBRC 16725]|uniref:Putative iron-sulfur protein n=1 Tax=Caenibius tardaugens NBRC 16725 TaxID=1219035 RepID=U2YMQ9_9SPHN|nr:aromatic ring-hydroxylating dioxygenase subunit alpha [Caenibius tardaugens]GAD50055.1 putative iron-sulfur protein [Caenibius tardaugens NBRC 16725]
MPQERGPVPRCPGPSTRDILTSDPVPAPALLDESGVDFLGEADLPMDAYLSEAFHREEIDKVWKRTWQMAARTEVLREAGSCIVYDIGDASALVVRGRDGGLRAFVNSCPHRGTRLFDADGKTLRIRCPFHGLSWTLDGKVDKWPGSWDFRHVDPEDFALDAIAVAEWNGFVFINFAADAIPLADYLEDLPAHFARWPLDQRYTAAHVSKVMDCNWKIALEAFLETFHVVGLHPESLPFFGDASSQYDVWEGQRHYSRMINPSGVISPHLSTEPAPERVLAAAARFGLCSGDPLEQGETPRGRIAGDILRLNKERLGVDLSHYSTSELVDVIEYYLFPNLVLFGGFNSPLTYRARPCGDDPNRCLFEVWLLLPFAEGATPPPPAPLRALGPDERFSDVPELSYFGPVIDQDADAMPLVQRGMRSSRKRAITLGNYQEIRIRHMRQTLNAYLGRPIAPA